MSEIPFNPQPVDDEPPILRVSEVSASIRELLEESFPFLRVQGEISNLEDILDTDAETRRWIDAEHGIASGLSSDREAGTEG